MRWQRSALAFLRRYTDLGYAGGLHQVLPVVVPTISLGDDRTDVERTGYVYGISGTADPGELPHIILAALDRDVEVLAAWASRPGNAEDYAAYFSGIPAGFTPTRVEASSSGVPPTAGVGFISSPIAGSFFVFGTAQQNTSFFFPLGGIIVPRGRALWMETQAAGTTLRGGFVWRELDNR